jgi:hypothetical protein
MNAARLKPKIGIAPGIQPEGHADDKVPWILMIHDALNTSMNQALARYAARDAAKPPQSGSESKHLNRPSQKKKDR